MSGIELSQKGMKNMLRRKIHIALFFAMVMSAIATTVGAQSKGELAPTPGPKGRLEGTWLTDVTFTDGFQLKVLFTFMPGKSENDGTLIDTNEFQLTPNPVCTPDQGTWQRLGDREFIATHLAFCFDANNGYLPDGRVKVRDRIRINDRGDQFTGTQHVEIFDTGGTIVATFDATMRGVRVNAEAPPQ